MKEPQLPLFDWPVMVMGEGYRKLAAFHFDEAEKHFNDVLQVEQGEEDEARQALHACKYWRVIFEVHKENPDNYSTGKLYKEVRQYDFENVPGLLQLKNALLEYIAGQMLSNNRFYIDGPENESVFDILIELRLNRKAESVILQQIEKDPDDVQFRYSRAQIQWLSKQKGEAKKNYARGLLLNPCRIPSHRILYKQLLTLIDDVGPEMAPLFGWVRKVLPLIHIRENLDFCSGSHRRAIDCYRLLWSADKALQNRDFEACYRYRKKLKAEVPELYDEYFALLSGRDT